MKINTFLIGAQKAGTSTFWNWLSQHPQICAPETVKDLHFFSEERWKNKSINYLEQFYSFKDESVIMQGGVNYYMSETFLKNAKQYNGDAKYILIFRNPIDRAWSAHQYFTKLGIESRDFDEAISAELNNEVDEKDMHQYGYLEHGKYYKYLKQIINHIDPSKLLILFYEEVYSSPKNSFDKVIKFLEISPYEFDFAKAKNVTGSVKFGALNKFLFNKDSGFQKVIQKSRVTKLVPLEWKIKLGNYIRDKNTSSVQKKESLHNAKREDLSSFFKKEMNAFDALIQEEFSISCQKSYFI